MENYISFNYQALFFYQISTKQLALIKFPHFFLVIRFGFFTNSKTTRITFAGIIIHVYIEIELSVAHFLTNIQFQVPNLNVKTARRINEKFLLITYTCIPYPIIPRKK